MIKKFGQSALFAAVLASLSVPVLATVLTFESDTGGFVQLNGSPMNPAYGDNVTMIPDTANGFGYGSAGGLTPNVTASYYNASTYASWGVTTHVMTMQYDPYIGTGDNTVSVTLSADPGYVVSLNSFDAAYYGGGAFEVPIRVIDGSNNVLWSAEPLSASGLSHQNFGGLPLTASTLTLELLNPSTGVALNFGADNIEFSQMVAQQPGWKSDASGNWNFAANWVGGIPNGTTATATFGNVISSPQTVYTNTAVSVGTLVFDSPSTYVLAGAGSLTIDAGGAAQVNVLQGSHQIALRSIFASNTNISVATGATLTIGNPMTIKAGKVVTKTGNLIIEAPLTIEANAALSLGAGPAAVVFGAPSLASGAHIDVQNNSMVIDYRGQASPAATIKNQLKTGHNAGAWDGSGINTSFGTTTKGLGWKDDAGSESIQIKYAYYGDTDLSGTVTSTDFSALVAGYGKTTGATWADGDFDYDGKVNTKDFNFLAGNFGAPAISGASLGSVVPEPGSTCLLLGGLLLLARQRRSIHF